MGTEATTARKKHSPESQEQTGVHVDEELLRATDPKAWHSGVEGGLS